MKRISTKIFSTIFFLWFALSLNESSLRLSHADFYIHDWSNHHQSRQITDFSARIGFYSSTQNFGDTSLLSIPMNFQSYSRIISDLGISHGLTHRITLYGNLNWSRVQLNHDINPGTAFGMGDQSVGFNFRLFDATPFGSQRKSLTIDLQGQVDFPLYNNTSSNNNQIPFLGDASSDFSGGVFVAQPFMQSSARLILLEVGGGYTYRTAGFSAAIPWSAYFRHIPNTDDGLLAFLGLAGVLSLETDTSPPLGTSGSLGSGGSYMTNAVNPHLMNLQAGVGYQVSPEISFIGNGSFSVFGINAPSGFIVTMGLNLSMGKTKTQKHPMEMTPEEYGKSNQGFLNYSLEAQIMKTNDRLNMVKINKGTQDGVEVGQIFDIFILKQDRTSGEGVARAKVTNVRNDESVLSITEYYKEVWIDEGFIAKRLIP